MKVILFKLDIPGDKYSWFFHDIEIKVLEDIEKVMGYCAEHIYAELYQIDENDDPVVVERVKEDLPKLYPETAKDIIMRLFKYYERVAKVWNEQGNKESLPESSGKRS